MRAKKFALDEVVLTEEIAPEEEAIRAEEVVLIEDIAPEKVVGFMYGAVHQELPARPYGRAARKLTLLKATIIQGYHNQCYLQGGIIGII